MDHGSVIRLLRFSRLALSALTSLAASAFCAGLLAGGWTADGLPLKLAACGLVVAVGALSWFVTLRVGTAALPLLAGGLLLVAFGSAALVWAIHLGLTTGDFEYWAMLLHLLIGSQGVATVVGLFLEGRHAARPPNGLTNAAREPTV